MVKQEGANFQHCNCLDIMCKTVMFMLCSFFLFFFQGKSLKAMVVLNSSGLLNLKRETSCGKLDIMLGMLTWPLDQDAR